MYGPDSLDNGVQSQPARSETFCHRLPLKIEAFTKRITLGLHCPVPLRSQDKRTLPPIPPSHASTTDFPSASGETSSASAHGSLLPPASPTPKTSQRAQPPQDPTILPVCGLPTRARCLLSGWLFHGAHLQLNLLSRKLQVPETAPSQSRALFFTQSYSLSHRPLAVTHPPCGKSG